jgi:dihydrofolate synthase/folylpolyglutamate synthase
MEFTERIRINGKPIDLRSVVTMTRELQPVVRRFQTTFFETTTALAFRHFADEKVDIAVIETGLGGRLDATNVVTPLLSVITTIGLEHTEILGSTIRQIAYEKAGIIKRGVPCVTGVRSGAALQEIRRIARRRNAPLSVVRASTTMRQASLEGTEFDFRWNDAVYRSLFLTLAGKHQIANAALALSAVELLKRRGMFTIPEKAVRAGFGNVQRYTGFFGRLSLVCRKPLIIADVAHNPDAIQALVASLQNLHVRDVLLLFGVSKDKDYRSMVQRLKPIVGRAIVVAARTERALPAQELRRAFAETGLPVEAESSVKHGVERARSLSPPRQPILITGSHFVVGEALAVLHRKKYLTINQ